MLLRNLTINNPNGVTVTNNDLKIDGTLTLTSGVITTGSNKIIIADPSASSISNGSTTSFINGNLRREIGTNTDTYTFPIGNGTGASKYHRVDMINNNLSGVSHIDAVVGDMPAGNLAALNMTQLGSDLVEVFDRQWQLTPNVQPSGGSYGVNLYLNGVSGMVVDDNNFTVIKRDDGFLFLYLLDFQLHVCLVDRKSVV